ncbi:hypothetical protein LBUL_1006 [Lactobacillus delbrueckii subsp. bulgaricus ATCC BAA-365]|nr:hypothetical protein LBUL_1002 [Lactobacillus delbrueckii subsp. bulgaricus ATCC BAA-365]ABJ58564.1 hypothetical protein LBUL_1006 [Lactobacillus delbrueckii subsp. bulgaricus ATCC BAA-365]
MLALTYKPTPIAQYLLAAIDLFLAAIDSYRAILQQDTGILYPLATAGINVAVMD